MVMTDDDGLGRSRQFNRLRLLRTLLSEPAQSRAELGRTLGVSSATVTALLSELEQGGMVEQQADDAVDDRRRTIGRPPLQVSLSATPPTRSGSTSGTATCAARSATCAGRSSATSGPPATSTITRSTASTSPTG